MFDGAPSKNKKIMNILFADLQGFFAQSYIHKVRWSSNANEANKHIQFHRKLIHLSFIIKI